MRGSGVLGRGMRMRRCSVSRSMITRAPVAGVSRQGPQTDSEISSPCIAIALNRSVESTQMLTSQAAEGKNTILVCISGLGKGMGNRGRGGVGEGGGDGASAAILVG